MPRQEDFEPNRGELRSLPVDEPRQHILEACCPLATVVRKQPSATLRGLRTTLPPSWPLLLKGITMSSDTSQHDRVRHPRRILLVEESILAVAIAAAGLMYLYAWLPKPVVPDAALQAVQRLKTSLDFRPGKEDAVSLMAASRPMMHAIRQAQRLEARGVFNESTRSAWRAASDKVLKFSMAPIAATDGHVVRLWMRESEDERAAVLEAWMEELVPGRFAALEEQRLARVTADPSLAATLSEVTWYLVAEEAPDDVREQAFNLCQLHAEACKNAALIGQCRDIVGYDYWKAVCSVGSSEMGLESHAAIWRADYDNLQAHFDLAKEAYEEGFRAWRAVCDTSPSLQSDPMMVEDMKEHFERYREVLGRLDQPVTSPVMLQDLIGPGQPMTL